MPGELRLSVLEARFLEAVRFAAPIRLFAVRRSALGPVQHATPGVASDALRLAAELHASGTAGAA